MHRPINQRVWWRHWLSDLAWFVALYLGLLVFQLMGVHQARSVSRWLISRIGPRTRYHRIATRNLHYIWPDLAAVQQQKIMQQLWHNIADVLAEYPFLSQLAKHTPIEGFEHWPRDAAGMLQPAIAVSAHLANWELANFMLAQQLQLPFVTVYRSPNNVWIDRWLMGLRAQSGSTLASKSADGAKILLRALKNGFTIGLLVDQRMREGVTIPFLGQPAATTTAAADLAIKYQRPIVPVRMVRSHQSPTGYVFRIQPPLFNAHSSADQTLTVEALTRRVNEHLSAWIEASPSEWLWIHQRWIKWSRMRPQKPSLPEVRSA